MNQLHYHLDNNIIISNEDITNLEWENGDMIRYNSNGNDPIGTPFSNALVDNAIYYLILNYNGLPSVLKVFT